MVDDLKSAHPIASPVEAPATGLLGRFAKHFTDSPASFDVTVPNGAVQHFGPGAPSFHVKLKNAALLSPVCRRVFDQAARNWVRQAVDAGLLDTVDLRKAAGATRALVAEAKSSPR
jgi:hypothetical protein